MSCVSDMIFCNILCFDRMKGYSVRTESKTILERNMFALSYFRFYNNVVMRCLVKWATNIVYSRGNGLLLNILHILQYVSIDQQYILRLNNQLYFQELTSKLSLNCFSKEVGHLFL